MDSFKVTLVCLLICLPAIAGLRCLKCVDYFFDTDNEVARNKLRQGGLPEQPACRTPVDNTTTTLPLETCDEISGKVASCFFTIAAGSSSRSWISANLKTPTSSSCINNTGGGESIDVSFTRRGCTTIPAGMKDTCREETKLASGVGNADGSTCYCSTDKCNGQTRLVPSLAAFFFILLAFFSLRE